MTIFLFILLVIACVGLFIQNDKIKQLKKEIATIPREIPNIDIDTDPFGADKPQKNRRGIIKDDWTETNNVTKAEIKYTTYTEIEEIENLGTLSRIKIINITGANKNVRNTAEERMPEIVEQSKIKFF